jgi:hypothetical protein
MEMVGMVFAHLENFMAAKYILCLMGNLVAHNLVHISTFWYIV